MFAQDGNNNVDLKEPPLKEDLEERVKSENAPIVGKLKIHIVHANELPDLDVIGTIDPFCRVTFGNQKYNTKIVKNNQTAIWKEVCVFDVNVPTKVP